MSTPRHYVGMATIDPVRLGNVHDKRFDARFDAWVRASAVSTTPLDVLTDDGLRLTVGATDDDELAAIVAEGGRRGEIYRGFPVHFAELLLLALGEHR